MAGKPTDVTIAHSFGKAFSQYALSTCYVPGCICEQDQVPGTGGGGATSPRTAEGQRVLGPAHHGLLCTLPPRPTAGEAVPLQQVAQPLRLSPHAPRPAKAAPGLRSPCLSPGRRPLGEGPGCTPSGLPGGRAAALASPPGAPGLGLRRAPRPLGRAKLVGSRAPAPHGAPAPHRWKVSCFLRLL